jgi:hypothetical protein
MPNLLRAEDVAEEDEERVASDLKGEETKLERDEEVAAEAPELAKVSKQTFFLCHAIFCPGPRECDLAQQSRLHIICGFLCAKFYSRKTRDSAVKSGHYD